MKQQTKESAIIIIKHAFKRAKSRLFFSAHALKKGTFVNLVGERLSANWQKI